ncbi:MAG: hypothetical protein ABSD98_06320 [Candidatus Korobacteraceae bacterium]|jgi:hypothetical protein
MEDWIKESFQKALKGAQEQLDKLVAEREKIDTEIIALKAVVDSLIAVAGEASDELPEDILLTTDVAPPLTVGLTDAIRFVLRDAKMALVVPQIRDQLIERGFDMSKYKQPLVPIHNAIKRLEDNGEVRKYGVTESGQAVYVWVSPIARALANSTPVEKGGALSSLSRLMKGELDPLGDIFPKVPRSKEKK